MLYTLGLGDRVIGITKFCIYPSEWYHSRSRVGGTKDVRIERVQALQPDLIIANKEENSREQVLALSKQFRVWVTDVTDLPSALNMIAVLGKLTGTGTAADALALTIASRFAAIRPCTPSLRVAYLIWKNPYMTIGNDTFIHDMLNRMGMTNVFGSKTRYPKTSVDELIEKAPDLIMLSSEPYRFGQKDLAEWSKLLPTAKTILVNGEFFSWYGSRLLLSPGYFTELLTTIAAGHSG
ncbi:putative ABC transporter substrate-binding protein [Flavihumibacter petaseus NBRC 106054]|uniref:Putative ABC transporter substrate-binding protein n=1 Tax=Flavihumibacter petaseus NBRC 106054 TaxID=1220578 RepID=A0A0E9N6J5_9BACT|nr:putative ABC transporter substrate-binding protein [Flavihumibacter petaseus NBRC 106054]